MGVRKLKELLGQGENKKSTNSTHPRMNFSSKARKREDFANRQETITIVHTLAFLNFFARLVAAGNLHWILLDFKVGHANIALAGGMLLFSCLMVGGLASPILIFLGTKLSRVALLASSALASGLLMVLLCFVKTFASFLAFYTILGAGLFLYIPLATNLYIDCSLYAEPTMLPLAASALLGATSGIGVAIVGNKDSFWSGVKVWRIVFLFEGLLLVIVSIVLLKFGRDPRQKKWEVKKIPRLSTGKVYDEFIIPFLKNKTYVGVVLANTFNTTALQASTLMVLWFYFLDMNTVWTPLNYLIGVIGGGVGCHLGYTLSTHFAIHPRARVVLAQMSVMGALGTVYLIFDYFPKSLDVSRDFYPVVTFAAGVCLGFPHAACDWPLLSKVFFMESRKNAFRYYWTFNSFFSSFGPGIVGLLGKLTFDDAKDHSTSLKSGLLVGVGLPLGRDIIN